MGLPCCVYGPQRSFLDLTCVYLVGGKYSSQVRSLSCVLLDLKLVGNAGGLFALSNAVIGKLPRFECSVSSHTLVDLWQRQLTGKKAKNHEERRLSLIAIPKTYKHLEWRVGRVYPLF